MKATIPLVARKGRASYLGERSAGHQDPGATSSYLLLQTAADTWSRRRLTVRFEGGPCMADYVGALDQGTTSTRFMIFDHGGSVVGDRPEGARADLPAGRAGSSTTRRRSGPARPR